MYHLPTTKGSPFFCRFPLKALTLHERLRAAKQKRSQPQVGANIMFLDSFIYYILD
nr:MAG TPA: hypothetical protein [Caudoviricetes sp.]